jgi:hypothetical protein
MDDRPVRRVRSDPATPVDESTWPGNAPAVAQILRDGLDVPAGLTVLVGENGSGKSTVVEMLAEAYGLNPQGGSIMASNFRPRKSEPDIGASLVAERGPSARAHWSYFLRADTMHGLYSYLEENPGGGAGAIPRDEPWRGFPADAADPGEPGRFLPDGRAGFAAVLHGLPRAGRPAAPGVSS